MGLHVIAPFTDEQVKHINEFQQLGWFHPFKCANAKHRKKLPNTLVAYTGGLICPGCGYYQDWVHTFMTAELKPTFLKHGVIIPNQRVKHKKQRVRKPGGKPLRFPQDFGCFSHSMFGTPHYMFEEEGLSISVISGPATRGDGINTWEVMVNDNSPVTMTKQEITELITQY